MKTLREILQNTMKLKQYFGKERYSPLLVAVMYDQPDVVPLLLEKGADVNEKLKVGRFKGETALILAATLGHIRTAEKLLELGADVNLDDDGWRPLCGAVRKGNMEMIKFLISKGADHTLKDSFGLTMVELANKFKHDEVKEYLLSLEQENKSEGI